MLLVHMYVLYIEYMNEEGWKILLFFISSLVWQFEWGGCYKHRKSGVTQADAVALVTTKD